jgi:hypothetical protein
VSNPRVTAFAARQQQSAQRDAILYLGVNESSEKTERLALRGTGATVIDAAPSATADEVSVGQRTFDLSVESGRLGFVDTLGLPKDTKDNIEQVLRRAAAGSRDELAEIAKALAPAERGTGAAPSRIVLSGHSLGGEVFGSAGRLLVFSDLYALAKAMPAAARGIEDVHFSGCSTEEQLSDAQQVKLRDAFPNLRSTWGYNGAAPEAPVDHLRAWERTTRGSSVPTADGIRGLSNVGVVAGALRMEAPLSRAAIADGVREADARFEGYMSGAVPIRGAHGGAAETTHRAYQRAAARQADPALQTALRGRAVQMGLLRYYEQGVRREFQRAHGDTIAKGYERLGLSAPDFSRLSRKEALDEIKSFETSFARLDNAHASVGDARTLLNALFVLDPAYVRPEWCVE